jgi:hypothetical protein
MSSLGQYSSYLRGGGIAAGLIGVPVLAGLSLGKGEGSLIIMGVVFVSLLSLLLLFWIGLRIWKAKKGNALSKMLRKDAGSVDISGIESLRSNFEDGVEKLKKANKNVYDLPWFLLAGQAGAGKTEAVRRSHAKEDFPAGLNDMMQGVGGTLNMNWWFTNKGIILDTAGRIFEEKVRPGQSTEWQEFLKMLKKARKNMPINGFILAIPADSLIRDDVAAIEEKASHIAEQITLVQNMLGVRFPVFIIVTKADFIPGFREFVENVTDPRLQQQMLGWSNPRGLDEPFAPEQVDSYLDGVIQKLNKRRLTYMLDPRPSGKKRLDDLDALFTFPNHLRDAVPNLRRYIEIVFSLNPWSQKPLFIRGIYFTSSLQQGDALDAALAEVMGTNLNEMALSSFKKEIPLFLRDAFFEKIYRESGLVTSAGKVKGAMRRRLIIFSLACVLGIGAILAAAFFGSRSFREGVGDQYAHWRFAAEEYEDEAGGRIDWQRSIVYSTLGDNFESEKNTEFELGPETYTLPSYFLRLADFAQSELEVPGVFKPLKFFDDVFTGNSLNREDAYRTVYQDAIILPVLENSREKMRGTEEGDWDERSLDGLRAQIRMQLLLNQEERGPGYSAAFWAELDALFAYLTGDRLGPELQEAYERFFGDTFIAESGWPSEESSVAYAATDGVDIEDDRSAAIARGLNLWMNQIESVRERQEDQVADLSRLVGEVEALGQFEEANVSQAIDNASFDADALGAIEAKREELRAALTRVSGLQEGFLFVPFYESQIEAAKARVEERVGDVSLEIDSMGGSETELGGIILERIADQRQSLIDSFDELADPDLLTRFRLADERYLADAGGFDARLSAYRLFQNRIDEMRSLHLDIWSEARNRIAQARALKGEASEAIEQFDGYLNEPLARLASQAEVELEKVERLFVERYRLLVRREVSPFWGFPILADAERILSKEEVAGSAGLLPRIVSYGDALVGDLRPGYEENLTVEIASLRRASNFVVSELLPIIESGRMKVVFPSLDQMLGGAVGLESLRQSVLWRARFVHLEGSGTPTRIGRAPINLGELTLDANRMAIVFSSTLAGKSGDSGRLEFSGGWTPIRILFENPDLIREKGGGVFQISGRLRGGPANGLSFTTELRFDPALPARDTWLRKNEFNGF